MAMSEDSQIPSLQAEQFLVLLVDDVASNLKILRSILSPIGYRLTFASSGTQAIARAASARPDLMLLDLMMPDIDGIQVAQTLKADPTLADIPIIFLTASQDPEHLIEAFASGAVDYLTKPFRAEELLARVKTHLELSALRQQMRRQVRKESTIRQMIQDIHYSLNLCDILDRSVINIQTFLDADRVMVCRCISPNNYKIVAVANSPRISPLNSESSVTLDEAGLLTNVSCEQAACSCYFLINSEALSSDQQGFLERFQAKTVRWIPIVANTKEWGALVVCYGERHNRSYQDEDDILIQVAEQMAIAIQQAELLQNLQTAHTDLKETIEQLEQANREIEKIANIDGLTQIANRRYLDSYLQREWLRLRREQLPLAIILCDIDYFKQYNDYYGHLAGDDCLRAIAQTLSQMLKRPADLIARYGGEEMVVVLPNTSVEGAIELVQSMQQVIQSLAIPHDGTSQPQKILSLSFGIACTVPSLDTGVKDLINAADQALYSAKRHGRNRYAIVDYSGHVWISKLSLLD